MKIAVVGGGITGLVAGLVLAEKGHAITIFEKDSSLGGLASCFKKPTWNWALERYYHHFFTSDDNLLQLAKKLGLEKKLVFSSPKTSVFVDTNIFRFDNPQSILSFPKLGIIDKIRTGVTTVFLKLNPVWKPLEKITAIEFLKLTMGPKTLDLIWRPLLESKFGDEAANIPASWLWTRIKKRSFSLGYFEGGTQTLIDALSKKIKETNGQIFYNSEVTKINKKTTGFEITLNNQKKAQPFDLVIASLPPDKIAAIFPELAEKEQDNLGNFKSLGSLCLVLSLKQSFLTDKTYWLNINDQSFPFVAVVEHTNYIDKKNYNNEHILYVGGYYSKNHPLMKLNKEAILKNFIPWLKKINPTYDFSQLTISASVFKDFYSQPIPGNNYSQNIPKIKTNIKNFFWASLHHVYPEDRGVNYAVKLGQEIANEIS